MANLGGTAPMIGWVYKHRTAKLVGVASLLTALSLTGLHWLLTVLAFGALSLLAVIRPQVSVAIVVLGIPVQSEIMLPLLGGGITFTQLTLFSLIAGWGVVFWRRRIWLDSIVVGFLLVLAAYFISFIAVDSPSNWLEESYRWAIAGVFYVICRSVISGWKDVRLILWAMLAGVAGMTGMSMYQFAFGAESGVFMVGGSVRVYGSFGTPNPLAAYLEMTIPVLFACVPIAWFLRGEFRAHVVEKWLFILIPIGGFIIILLTQSRGGLLGIVAASIVLLWLLPRRARFSMATLGVVVLAVFLLTAPGQSQLARFGTLLEETNQEVGDPARSSFDVGAGRGALWATARIMIAENPLTGIGAGEFDENYREHVPSWIDRLPRGQAHNVWLQMGAQAGIWGVVAYAWWFAASVWSVITARRRVVDSQRRWLMTGILAVFAAYTVHSMVDYLNVLSLGLQLSVLTAIALNFAPEPLTRYSTVSKDSDLAQSTEIAPCPM